MIWPSAGYPKTHVRLWLTVENAEFPGQRVDSDKSVSPTGAREERTLSAKVRDYDLTRRLLIMDEFGGCKASRGCANAGLLTKIARLLVTLPAATWRTSAVSLPMKLNKSTRRPPKLAADWLKLAEQWTRWPRPRKSGYRRATATPGRRDRRNRNVPWSHYRVGRFIRQPRRDRKMAGRVTVRGRCGPIRGKVRSTSIAASDK